MSTALEMRAFLLLELMVPQYRLSGVRLDNLAELAKRCRDRKPSRARRLQEPTRALEIVCFLRHAWLEINVAELDARLFTSSDTFGG